MDQTVPAGDSGRRISRFRRPPPASATARSKRPSPRERDRARCSSRRSTRRTGAIVGVEALARWDGADTPAGSCSPAPPPPAWPSACRGWSSARRCARRRSWAGRSSDLHLSINLLPEDLARAGYDDWLLDEIAAAGIDPERITVEITESALLADSAAIAERLARLRAAGVRIAVDDFGTGYASLAYLTSLPLDTLKIDRGLIADIVGGKRDRIVVKAMIAPGPRARSEGGRRRRRKHRPAGPARRLGLRPLPGLPRRRRARRAGAGALRRRLAWRRTRPRPARAPSLASPAATTRASPRDNCSAPFSRASAVGQSRLTTSLLSGRSLAAPFSRST